MAIAESSSGPILERWDDRLTRSPGWNPLAWLTVIGVGLAHVVFCWRFVGGQSNLSSPWPFLMHDHPFVYHYGRIGAEALKQNGTTVCYDPTFMAGYASSFIGATSPLVAVILALFPGHPAIVYKWFVFSTMASLPFIVFFAIKLFRVDSWDAMVIALLWLIVFWIGYYHIYVMWGMTPFVWSTSWGLLVGALASRLLERAIPARDSVPLAPNGLEAERGENRVLAPGRVGSVPLVTVAVGVVAGIACLAHVSSPVALAPPMLLAWALCWRRQRWGQRVAIVAAGLIAIMVNLFWLAPGLALWETKGDVPGFFVNPNVIERLYELLYSGEGAQGPLTALALVGLCFSRRRLTGPAQFVLLACLGWFFLMSYPGGYWRALDPLQPGRNTLHLNMWMILPAAWGIRFFLADRRWRGRERLGFAAILAVLYLGPGSRGAATMVENVRLLFSDRQIMVARPPSWLQGLAQALSNSFEPGKRIFFEERNQGVAGFHDPFGDIRASIPIADMTRLSLVGGPWLLTHYRTNYCQVGDGKLFHGEWTRERFLQLARIYDVHGLVCWSPEGRRFCAANLDLLEEVFSQDGLFAFRLRGPRREKESRPAVTARLNLITVHMDQLSSAPVLIPFHDVPGLIAQPKGTIRPVLVGDDPAPLIELSGAPDRCEIRFDPWSWLRIGRGAKR